MTRKVLVSGSGSAAARHLSLVPTFVSGAQLANWRRQKSESDLNNPSHEVFEDSEVASFVPEISIVASPASEHLVQVKSLLDCGSHVLVEKPLSTSIEGVEALFDYAAEAKRIIQVGYNLRFLDSLRVFEELLESRKLGDIQSINIEVDQYLPDWRPNANYQSSVSATKSLGGGALLELSHEVDLAIWLFGEFQLEHASMKKLSALDIDVEDTVTAEGEFLSFQNRKPKFRILLGMINRAPRRFCEVVGSETSARWNGLLGTVEIFNVIDRGWDLVFENQDDVASSYERQLQVFLERIESGFIQADHESTKSHELNVLKALDEIRAFATGHQFPGITK
jgi:predicted dehydrogenase